MFQRLIKQIQLARISSHHEDNGFLTAMAARYTETPTQEKPIILSQASLETLINMAISEKLMLTAEDGRKSFLLTTLIGMGSWQGRIDDEFCANHPSNADIYLGRKDHRIETMIAARAKEEIVRRKTCAMKQTNKIAVFGSSMNPPTENHLHVIQHLVNSGYFVEIIPNAASPLKSPAQYAPPWDRYAMIKKALDAKKELGSNRYHVSTLELSRPAPSRMFMTLCALILLSKQTDTFTLILTMDDNFLGFDHWYHWKDLATLCSIQFYPRPGITETISQEQLKSQLNKLLNEGAHIIIPYQTKDQIACYQSSLGADIVSRIEWKQEKELCTIDGSSSSIRRQLQYDASVCPIGLPDIVYEYIIAKRLYR